MRLCGEGKEGNSITLCQRAGPDTRHAPPPRTPARAPSESAAESFRRRLRKVNGAESSEPGGVLTENRAQIPGTGPDRTDGSGGGQATTKQGRPPEEPGMWKLPSGRGAPEPLAPNFPSAPSAGFRTASSIQSLGPRWTRLTSKVKRSVTMGAVSRRPGPCSKSNGEKPGAGPGPVKTLL